MLELVVCVESAYHKDGHEAVIPPEAANDLRSNMEA